MNNNRLSTSGNNITVNRLLLLSEVADFLKLAANAELRDGKIWIKSEKRFLSKKKAVCLSESFIKRRLKLTVHNEYIH